jgi:serine/threonine-protein kinase
MLRRGSVPDGFIYVPRGTIRMGGDVQAFTQLKDETRVVGDVFIAEREVTVGEYLAFLNDPAQRAERQNFEPYDPDDPAPHDPSGRPAMSIGGDAPLLLPDEMPILGVPFAGADRYCQWLSARNPKWRFRLPRTNEWMRAACGSDSRPFPWGPAFAWLFCKSGFCRPKIPFTSNPALPEPIVRCLGDESPFGVRDLAGSAREWLASEGIQNQAPLIGGSWVSTNMRDFRCTSPDSRSLQECDWTWGFRICAEAKEARVGK